MLSMDTLKGMSLKEIYEACEEESVRLVINGGEVKEIIKE